MESSEYSSDVSFLVDQTDSGPSVEIKLRMLRDLLKSNVVARTDILSVLQ